MSYKSRLVGAVLGGSLLFGASLASADVTVTYPGTGCVEQQKPWSSVRLYYFNTEALHLGSGTAHIGCPVPQLAGRVIGGRVTGHNYNHVTGVSCNVWSLDPFGEGGFVGASASSTAMPHYGIKLPALAGVVADGATFVKCMVPGTTPNPSSVSTYIVTQEEL